MGPRATLQTDPLPEAITMNGKTVTIESAGVCKIRGRKKLKLQESDKAKGKGGGGGLGEIEEASGSPGTTTQKPAVTDQTTLEIHVVDLNKKPQEGLAFKIKKPDVGIVEGRLDKEGRGFAKSTTPGIFSITFPDLDGADWDGDGAQKLPPEESRSEASKYEVKQGDRLPTIARKKGFARWQTVWEFAKNEGLRNTREDPNVLQPGDMVVIPARLNRVATVSGGKADYVVKSDGDGWTFDLWIRLDIDPDYASEKTDMFSLTSTDGTVAIRKTIANDQVPNDESIDLLFENLDGEKSYTLKVKSGEDEYFAFQGVSGWDLHHMHDEDETGDSEDGSDESDTP
jgi:hypothetical protein